MYKLFEEHNDPINSSPKAPGTNQSPKSKRLGYNPNNNHSIYEKLDKLDLIRLIEGTEIGFWGVDLSKIFKYLKLSYDEYNDRFEIWNDLWDLSEKELIELYTTMRKLEKEYY